MLIVTICRLLDPPERKDVPGKSYYTKLMKSLGATGRNQIFKLGLEKREPKSFEIQRGDKRVQNFGIFAAPQVSLFISEKGSK